MDYTKNYHLPQWVKEDRIMMEDFNDAMANLESGITNAQTTADTARNEAAELPYVVGSYTGDDSRGRNISLGFRPSFVIISGQIEGYNIESGADRYYIATAGTAFQDLFGVTDDGFWVTYITNHRPGLNTSGRTYDYIAFR